MGERTKREADGDREGEQEGRRWDGTGRGGDRKSGSEKIAAARFEVQ